jgi:hypothetical protein
MGVYYHYVNHDKRQHFICGLCSWDDRFSGIGRGPGARALAILLSERGTWRNDRISVIGDDGVDSKEFEYIFVNYIDIEIEAQLMLLDVDGVEWIEAVIDSSPNAFSNLCQFAIHLRRPDVIALLDAKYGVGNWQRRYEEYLKRNTDTWSQKIVEAGNRRLKLLV